MDLESAGLSLAMSPWDACQKIQIVPEDYLIILPISKHGQNE